MATDSGAMVKPTIDFETAKKVIFDLYGLKVITICELNGYDDKNFHVLVDKHVNNNGYVEKVLEDGYVFKVINSLDSLNSKGFEAQTELMMHLNENNIRCSRPVLTKYQKFFEVVTLSSGSHIVRLLDFIPGDILFRIPNPPSDVFYQVGVWTAKMDNALQNFRHPAYHKNIQWCLGAAPDILNYLHAVDDSKKNMVKNIILEFSSRVLTKEDNLSKGLIHGDINEQNLIVKNVNSKIIVTAVIDFGDSHYCCYLYELALAMTYMIFTSNNIDSGGYVLAGYSSCREVLEEDFKVLKVCVMTRLCQSLVLGAYANLQDPGNEYILTTAKKGWTILEQLLNESEEDVLNRWKSIKDSYQNL